MEKEKQAQKDKDAVFKRQHGIKPETFKKMEAILLKKFEKLYKLVQYKES